MLKAVFLAVSLLVGVAPALAQAPALNLNRVQSLLKELGHSPTVKDDVVTLDGLTDRGIDVDMQITDDKKFLYVYSSWTLPADKRDQIPFVDILRSSENNRPYTFGFYGEGNELNMTLGTVLDVASVNNRTLRQTVDGLAKLVNSTDALWDSTKWRAPATPAAKTDAAPQAAAPAPAPAIPPYFVVHQVEFTTRNAAEFGDIAFRPNNSFAVGEVVRAYVETAGQTTVVPSPGKKRFAVQLKAELTRQDGTDIGSFTADPTDLTMDDSTPSRLYINQTVTLGNLPPGGYILTFVISDVLGDRVVRIRKPLTITAAK